MRFRDFVTTRILRPLDMTSTVWQAGDVPAERLATGYAHDGDRFVPDPRRADGAFDAAGGLYTSLRDFALRLFQLGGLSTSRRCREWSGSSQHACA